MAFGHDWSLKKGSSYRICINLPHRGCLKDASINCEWKLQHKIKHKAASIVQRLKSAENISSFLKDFIAICESCLKWDVEPVKWCDINQILQQIQELGWDRVTNVSKDLSQLELVVADDSGRQHKMTVTLDMQDLSSIPVCSVDFPEKFNFHWTAESGLKHLYQQFEAAVNANQSFWNMLSEIDNNCWVLEPEHPTFAATHRRIALGPNISLHVTVNCRQPYTLPECRLLGAESAVAELREKLNVNLHRWDVERSLLKNLEEVLDIDFPSPTNISKEELSVDCGICYCHLLNEEVPDVVCEDKRCGQAFHRTCLYEWLRGLSSRQSFNTLFGDCPLCSHPIRVKIFAG
ncbi:fanconi anemia complementation group l [Plakobranchus ocellatus]|uniref:Fanconi anemia complementation group l n=1 Tax=Plakobranchus ocellatus TaxID=259542 RepID=A0AAV4AF48_9GAST|nr:fanconi anemia complementation group l [Plakobranchus ocellatus]